MNQNFSDISRVLRQVPFARMLSPSCPLLVLSDIENIILPPPCCLDGVTATYVQAHRMRLHELRLAKLNAVLPEFERIWPDGRPIDFFLAFGLCDYDTDVTKERLYEPSFIRVVLAVASASGYGIRVSPAFSVPERTRRSEGSRDPKKKRQSACLDWRVAEREIRPAAPVFSKDDLRLAFVKDGIRFPVGGHPIPLLKSMCK